MSETKLENVEAAEMSKVVNEENIPSIFCDGFKGLAVHGGVVRLNLTEDRYDVVAKEIKRHVIARLIIPVEGAEAFVKVLGGSLEAYKNKDNQVSDKSVAIDTEIKNEKPI